MICRQPRRLAQDVWRCPRENVPPTYLPIAGPACTFRNAGGRGHGSKVGSFTTRLLVTVHIVIYRAVVGVSRLDARQVGFLLPSWGPFECGTHAPSAKALGLLGAAWSCV